MFYHKENIIEISRLLFESKYNSDEYKFIVNNPSLDTYIFTINGSYVKTFKKHQVINWYRRKKIEKLNYVRF